MSKMDDLRAMREARYAANQARAAKSPPSTRSPAARPPVAPAAPASEELCGHRNMSGRSCTREKDHAAKSHRYS